MTDNGSGKPDDQARADSVPQQTGDTGDDDRRSAAPETPCDASTAVSGRAPDEPNRIDEETVRVVEPEGEDQSPTLQVLPPTGDELRVRAAERIMNGLRRRYLQVGREFYFRDGDNGLAFRVERNALVPLAHNPNLRMFSHKEP